MKKKTISLCMIVKNEENVLDVCLSRVKDYVDEIVIVDTGSTDNTINIAEKYTDKIYHFEWCDDYSAPRNYANQFATCEYILNLDADELVLEYSFFDKFQKSDREYFSSHILNCKFEQDKSYDFDYYYMNMVVQFENSRVILYKNNTGFHYEGIIHEYIVNRDGEKPIDDPEPLSLKILHVGSVRKKQFKSKYYNELGLKQLESGQYQSNRANLALNLLHHYQKYGEYTEYDKIYEKYYADILIKNTATSFVRLIRKLIIKGHYQRAYALTVQYREWKELSYRCQLESNAITQETRCFYYLASQYSSLEEWEQKVNQLLEDSKSHRLRCLVMNHDNFVSEKLFADAIELAFAKGIDYFEINVSMESVQECERFFDVLGEYPVICNLNIFEDLNLNPSRRELQIIKIKMGDVFIRLPLIELDLQKSKTLLERYQKWCKNVILNFSNIKNFSTITDYCQLFIEFSQKEEYFLNFEGLPICFIIHHLNSDENYSKELSYINDTVQSNNLDCLSQCDCYLKDYCLVTCSQVIRQMGEDQLLRPVTNFLDLFKYKARGAKTQV